MANKEPQFEDAPDHPMRRLRFVHESDIYRGVGWSWTTWERNYRSSFPGRMTPSGKWATENQAIVWWEIEMSKGDNDSSSNSQHKT
ncbi:MAG: hypothetical protein AAFX06_16530 [Planctomycetota bacterium]